MLTSQASESLTAIVIQAEVFAIKHLAATAYGANTPDTHYQETFTSFLRQILMESSCKFLYKIAPKRSAFFYSEQKDIKMSNMQVSRASRLVQYKILEH